MLEKKSLYIKLEETKKRLFMKTSCDKDCTGKPVKKPVNEVLSPSMGTKAYIDDFIKSDDPRFKGDSKEKRRQRAIAAFYADKNKYI